TCASNTSSFFFYISGAPPPLHSFPTRRSSDLQRDLGGRQQRPQRHPRQVQPPDRRQRRLPGPEHQLAPAVADPEPCCDRPGRRRDRKSTRLNSSHRTISYAVFCLKKKKKTKTN